jgi:hypothetical protein
MSFAVQVDIEGLNGWIVMAGLVVEAQLLQALQRIVGYRALTSCGDTVRRRGRLKYPILSVVTFTSRNPECGRVGPPYDLCQTVKTGVRIVVRR